MQDIPFELLKGHFEDLYKGIGVAMVHEFAFHGVFFLFYSVLKNYYRKNFAQNFGDQMSPPVAIAVGSLAGFCFYVCVSVFLGCVCFCVCHFFFFANLRQKICFFNDKHVFSFSFFFHIFFFFVFAKRVLYNKLTRCLVFIVCQKDKNKSKIKKN